MAAGSTQQPHEAACSPLSRSESREWSSCAQLAPPPLQPAHPTGPLTFRVGLLFSVSSPGNTLTDIPKMRLGDDLVVSSSSYVDSENEPRCSIRTDLLKWKTGGAAKESHVVGC